MKTALFGFLFVLVAPSFTFGQSKSGQPPLPKFIFKKASNSPSPDMISLPGTALPNAKVGDAMQTPMGAEALRVAALYASEVYFGAEPRPACGLLRRGEA